MPERHYTASEFGASGSMSFYKGGKASRAMKMPQAGTYRIVTEAVTNVVRHAHAARCWLTIATGPTVDIDVVDDGVGVKPDVEAGVGWTAMRERAVELGGNFQIEPHLPHGTHVRVRIPAVLA